jgi:hypothetical protein
MINWLCTRALRDVLPTSAAFPGLEACNLPAFVRRCNAEAPPLFKIALWASVAMWLASPIWTIYVPLPAVLLPRAWNDRHLRKMAGSRVYILRQVVLMLKQTGGACWGADPGVRKAAGMLPYPPDPGTWKGMP